MQTRNPGVACACNGAEGGGAKTSVRIIERRSVSDVEDLGAKLQAGPLRDTHFPTLLTVD